jgi:integrase
MSMPSSPSAGRRRRETPRGSGQAPQSLRRDRLGGPLHGPRWQALIAKPIWNGRKGTFTLKREAQRAIDEAYGLSDRFDTLGEYFATWTTHHPRSERTNETNEHRIGRVLEVEVEGIPLKQWPLRKLRRRHALALVDHMLRVQGRATTGAVGILRALSAMAEDAITDEVAELNPFKGVRIRASDPRAKKKRRPIRVFSFEEMHRFAKAAGRYEALVRTFTDTGMRLGEVLPLRCEDFDGETIEVRRTAHEGAILAGTKDRPRRAGRRPHRPLPSDPRLADRSPDPPQRSRLRPPLSQLRVAASGASATSTAMSGSRPRKPPA